MATETLTYSGGWLDRAATRRADPAWIRSTLAAPTARFIPLWRDRCLIVAHRPLSLPAEAATAVLAAAEPVLLGLDGDVGVFAVDLSALDEPEALAVTGASATGDVRRLVSGLTPAEAAALGHARGILHWHRNQRYCGACGGVTASRQGGNLRVCAGCGKLLFPRIEPAVIVLVESAGAPARCLLGRHSGAAAGSYSTLAGFVEVGESLEDAVRREVAEEAGVHVGEVSYQASQAWPFPAGLMVGFHARACDDEIAVDGAELVEARWFTRAQLRELVAVRPPNPDSIEKHLVESWLAGG